jgi:hypothetical protein
MLPPHAGRVLQIVAGSLLAIVALLVGLGAVLPRRWHVEQTIMINAPPAAIHAWVGDLQHWSDWAQWDQDALAPRNDVSNPSAGVGARLTWYGRASGHGGGASGTVHIVRSDPKLGVWFESHMGDDPASEAALTYTPRPDVTEVTWRDQGQLPPIVGGLFRDLFQQRLSQHMASGLQRLKDRVEHRATATDSAAPRVEAHTR